jgi:acyl-[acyl-carrier-protein]-phospholipid O-acyltransferase/long-chain-fatty-acid--[acyl-carrier-protein] ligase
MAGKVPVNLNFTAGREALTIAVERCQIRTILTSKAFLAKAGIERADGMVLLEDVMPRFSVFAKLRIFLTAFALPAWAVTRVYLRDRGADRLATIVFSSGSTGIPKGVMLTHRNVLANVDASSQLFQLTPQDVMLGVLPFFHSFGFTGTLWLPLIAGFGVVYHPNPMDAKIIGELAVQYRGTLIITTPTFAAAYLRKCQPEQFAHLRYAIVGAEKLREPVAAAFKEKFGVNLLEGYGCTEMAPIVAVSVPDVNEGGERQRGWEPGSVGQPLPGVAAKIVDPNTGEEPLFGQEGLLLVKGPSRMAGYLGDPDGTAAVMRDGWYVTGDIATIDDSGFIRITDRLSRFSKIGGEMVPHMKVEDEVRALLPEQHSCVVTGVPDPVKGERLIVFYTDPALRPQYLWERLCQTELPRLWLPKREDLHQIDAIPMLGTGKTDLRSVRQLALERSSPVGAR